MIRHVENDGVTLAVNDRGEGRPVALQPGLGYASWCWRWLLPEVIDQRRVLAIDTRGTGRSDKLAHPFSIEEMADDLAAMIGLLCDGPADVVGHSMGGYIAISAALRHPEVVRSLTLLATSGGGPKNLPVPEETVKVWRESAHLLPEEYARRTFPYSFRPGWTDEHPDRTQEALAIRLEHPTPPEQWLLQYNATVSWLEQGAPVEQIEAPTLVVHGTADRVVPYGNGERLVERIPGARLVTYDGVGHNLMIEEPHRLGRTLTSFWSTVQTGSTADQ